MAEILIQLKILYQSLFLSIIFGISKNQHTLTITKLCIGDFYFCWKDYFYCIGNYIFCINSGRPCTSFRVTICCHFERSEKSFLFTFSSLNFFLPMIYLQSSHHLYLVGKVLLVYFLILLNFCWPLIVN